jgi:hypothetical protein
VYGEVAEPLTSPGTSSTRLPKETSYEDIHCVTRWSRFDADFRRRRVVDDPRPRLAARARRSSRSRTRRPASPRTSPPRPSSSRARYSSPTQTGAAAPEHGCPCGSSYPGATSGRAPSGSARSSSAADAPGFWERYGYHNDADPGRSSGTRSEAWTSANDAIPRTREQRYARRPTRGSSPPPSPASPRRPLPKRPSLLLLASRNPPTDPGSIPHQWGQS